MFFCQKDAHRTHRMTQNFSPPLIFINWLYTDLRPAQQPFLCNRVDKLKNFVCESLRRLCETFHSARILWVLCEKKRLTQRRKGREVLYSFVLLPKYYHAQNFTPLGVIRNSLFITHYSQISLFQGIDLQYLRFVNISAHSWFSKLREIRENTWGEFCVFRDFCVKLFVTLNGEGTTEVP